MTGFLGRLLARSRDGADDVRPRLPGRFEPTSAPVTPPIAHAIAEQHQPETMGPPAAAAEPREPEPARQRRPRRVHRGRLEVREPVDADGTVHPRTDEREQPPRPATVEAASTRSTDETASPPDTTVLRPETRVVTRLVAPDRAPADDADVRTPSREPGPAILEMKGAAHLTEPPEARPARREPLSPRPRPASPKAPREPEPQSTEPPAIRIHIGRIDVRAVHDAPPAPAPAARPAPPSLSLEEYTRQRGRGER